MKHSIAIVSTCVALLVGQNVMAQEQTEKQETNSTTTESVSVNETTNTQTESVSASDWDVFKTDTNKSDSDVASTDANAASGEENTAVAEENAVVAEENAVVAEAAPPEDPNGDAGWSSIELRKYHMYNTHPAGRIVGEIAGGVLGVVPSIGVGLMLSQLSVNGGLYEDPKMKKRMEVVDRACVIGAFITPFLESAGVHLVGSLLGSWGESWTPYAGGAAGGAIGAGLGALGYLKSNSMGRKMIFVGAAIGALAGALTWYEISNKEVRDYYAISSIYPVLEVSDQRTVVGLGMEF